MQQRQGDTGLEVSGVETPETPDLRVVWKEQCPQAPRLDLGSTPSTTHNQVSQAHVVNSIQPFAFCI